MNGVIVTMGHSYAMLDACFSYWTIRMLPLDATFT